MSTTSGNISIFSSQKSRDDVVAAQELYKSKWSIITAPLDVTVLSQIGGEYYRDIFQSTNPVARVIIEQYFYWYAHCSWANSSVIEPANPQTKSSTLHDLVAAYMIDGNDYLMYQNLNIVVNGTGFTLIDSKGKSVVEALQWIKFTGINGWSQTVANLLQ
jgi:inosine-uridine nucleoside N-ribohydrolase